MIGVTALASLVLLVIGYDVANCVAFYRDANRASRLAPRAPDERRRLSPDQVALRHAFLFLIQKANYYWQLVTALVLLARLHLRPRPTADRDVALLMINTSLATWVAATPLGVGAVVATLRFEGFAFPFFPGKLDNRLLVETELRLSGGGVPFEARTVRFELNGVKITSPDEQLSILAVMISSVAHPVVHSFHNTLYRSHTDAGARDYEDLFLHGQYLNWCAWYWPGVMFRIPGGRGHHWYKQVLEWNAELPLPKGHGPAMVPLAPYSRFVRFILASRPLLLGLCDKYALPVSPEALFVCTILHACDHASCDTYTRGHRMAHEVLPQGAWLNLIALLFYRPAQHFWTNLLKDKHTRRPLYHELYRELRRLDPELADQVTLSISY